jgi:Polyketide cyclase / dehydrase and lipid transport
MAPTKVRLSIPCALLLMAIGSSIRADTAHPYHAGEAEQQGDIEVGVVLDSAGQRGIANAMVRIHARREVVWLLIKSCGESVKLVPGLVSCKVLETAPDRSWQIIRHVLDYSWFVPKLTYEIRATYDYPAQVSIERISGDLSVLKGSWKLQSDGDYTIAHYQVELAPGFWVPHWLVKLALRRDLPKMLSALRARAESVQEQGPASQGAI